MKLKSILIAGLLAASSIAVQAENLNGTVTLVAGPIDLSGGFNLTHVMSGEFWDTISIGPAPAAAIVNASMITIGMGTTNIDFWGATLNGNALTLLSSPGGYVEAGLLLPTATTGPLTLMVHGWAGPSPGDPNMRIAATYAGTVNVTPVPEPETYGMLLGGLGILAFLGRRRKS
jgi:hypothetical protein